MMHGSPYAMYIPRRCLVVPSLILIWICCMGVCFSGAMPADPKAVWQPESSYITQHFNGSYWEFESALIAASCNASRFKGEGATTSLGPQRHGIFRANGRMDFTITPSSLLSWVNATVKRAYGAFGTCNLTSVTGMALEDVHDIVFFQDGSHVLLAGGSDGFHLVNTTGMFQGDLGVMHSSGQLDGGSVRSAAVTSDQSMAIVCNGQSGVLMLDLADPSNPLNLTRMQEGNFRAFSAVITPDDQTAFIAMQERLWIVKLDGYELLRSCRYHIRDGPQDPRMLWLSKQELVLYVLEQSGAGEIDFNVMSIDYANFTSQNLERLSYMRACHNDTLVDAALAPNEQVIWVLCNRTGLVAVNIETMGIYSVNEHAKSSDAKMTSVAITANSHLLFVAVGNQVEIWDSKSPTSPFLLRVMPYDTPGNITRVRLSPGDASLFAWNDHNNVLEVNFVDLYQANVTLEGVPMHGICLSDKEPVQIKAVDRISLVEDAMDVEVLPVFSCSASPSPSVSPSQTPTSSRSGSPSSSRTPSTSRIIYNNTLCSYANPCRNRAPCMPHLFDGVYCNCTALWRENSLTGLGGRYCKDDVDLRFSNQCPACANVFLTLSSLNKTSFPEENIVESLRTRLPMYIANAFEPFVHDEWGRYHHGPGHLARRLYVLQTTMDAAALDRFPKQGITLEIIVLSENDPDAPTPEYIADRLVTVLTKDDRFTSIITGQTKANALSATLDRPNALPALIEPPPSEWWRFLLFTIAGLIVIVLVVLHIKRVCGRKMRELAMPVRLPAQPKAKRIKRKKSSAIRGAHGQRGTLLRASESSVAGGSRIDSALPFGAAALGHTVGQMEGEEHGALLELPGDTRSNSLSRTEPLNLQRTLGKDDVDELFEDEVKLQSARGSFAVNRSSVSRGSFAVNRSSVSRGDFSAGSGHDNFRSSFSIPG